MYNMCNIIVYSPGSDLIALPLPVEFPFGRDDAKFPPRGEYRFRVCIGVSEQQESFLVSSVAACMQCRN